MIWSTPLRERYAGLTVVALIALAACRPHARPAEGTSENAATGTHAAHAPSSVAATSPAPSINSSRPPAAAPAGMVWIPGGTFWMGCGDCGMPDALPVHLVSVSGFWMDSTPVTNAEFEKFVVATKYVTVAERKPDPADFPGVPADKLVPGAVVFTPPAHPVSLEDFSQWWSYVPGANWRHPEGPSSTLTEKAGHPVIHIAWADAVAYADWAGKRLPTEAEFEFAARGGLDRNLYPWGNQLKPEGRVPANIWEGHFPDANNRADGYFRTSPVTAFPANAYGLYDVGGNVWQWCADWYRADYYRTFTNPDVPARDPRGPESSLDPEEPAAAKRVTRGGSFLCSGEYCSRYLVGSRGKAEVSSGSSNLGFRLVRSAG
jgi:formylglycine-generating enzyme required for sulfatase activity